MGSDKFNQSLDMDTDDSVTQTDETHAPSSDFNTIIGCIEDIVISDNFQVSCKNIVKLELFLIWNCSFA